MARALVAFVGVVTIFTLLGPLLGGVMVLLPTASGFGNPAGAFHPVGLVMSFFLGAIPAAIAGLMYASALTAIHFLKSNISEPLPRRARFIYGWILGAGCGLAAIVVFLGLAALSNTSAESRSSQLWLVTIAAFAGACCGRLSLAWASGTLKANAWLVTVFAAVVVVTWYGPLAREFDKALVQLLAPLAATDRSLPRTGFIEFKTYQARQEWNRCGGIREPGRAPCDRFVTEGGAVLWRMPAAFVRGAAGTASVTIHALYPDMVPIRAPTEDHPFSRPGDIAKDTGATHIGITIHNARLAADYWEKAVAGELFRRKDAEQLPERMAGLIHFRDRAPSSCMRRRAAPESSEAQRVCLPDEYFVSPIDQKQQQVFITCGIAAVAEGGLCSARTEFRGWSVQYSLPFTQRHDWRTYDAKIRSLLQGFVHRECDAPTDEEIKPAGRNYDPRNCRPASS